MSKTLAGKVALVTGGSRGIGAAIAKKLAEQGADVAISYAASADKANEVVKDIEAKGVRAAAFKADQAKTDEVEGLVQSVVKRFGKIDILVNNAGVFATASVNERGNNLAELERLFAINVGGVATAVRTVAPLMKNGGRIISIGSVAGDTSPWPGFADYSATKGAVAAYTRGWARDLGARGITVNDVQPGPIDTDMAPKEGELADGLKSRTALGRYGKAEEVAAAVAFLASPEAGYITGTTINVDGGFNA
ncbi:MAG TPA: SDR family oxidoreductase [Methyloceanibacter sp.]|jgi:3-oxoacyl-[acyl-carrier protein] reductase